MYTIIASLALSFVSVLQPATPATPALPPDGRTVQCSGVVNTSVDELWKTFTTPEGWTSAIGVAKCEIDFRLGGSIRTVYNPQATIGDDSTITNKIIAYEPKRMLAFKPTAPKAAPDFIKAICETGWNVIRFEPLTPDRTRLTVTGMGYLDTELHKKAYDFFAKGNAWTLKEIQDHFATPQQARTVDDAETLIMYLAGKWSFTKENPDGSTFSGTTEGQVIFDGKLLVADGFLTIGGKTFRHSHFIAGLDPETHAVRAWNFNQDGDVTEGEVRLDGPQKLVIDWNTFQRSDNRFVEYRVEYTFHGPDEFGLVVQYSPDADGTRKTLVDVTYQRVPPGETAAK
jgi:uncharacterized protein YndB with AHSA1/START domain